MPFGGLIVPASILVANATASNCSDDADGIPRSFIGRLLDQDEVAELNRIMVAHIPKKQGAERAAVNSAVTTRRILLLILGPQKIG